MISVLISEDDPLLCKLVVEILRPHPDFRLIGAAIDGHDALYAIPEHRPDVLLLDLNLPRMSGHTILERLSLLADPPRVIVVSGYDTPENQLKVLREGADGFVSKATGLNTLPEAIRAVASGRVWIAPDLIAPLVRDYRALAEQVREVSSDRRPADTRSWTPPVALSTLSGR